MTDMISKNHSNRKAHNWLLYDIEDEFMRKYSPHFRGVLYDLGCGESPFRHFFLKHADRYVGVDWAGSYHKTAPDIEADLNRPLPIESAVADTVVSISVLEHLNEPQCMLDEAFRILKPGGHMILQVPFMWWVHEAPHDYFRYTSHGLRHLCEKAGFSVIEVAPQTGFWVMWTLKLNYQSTRLVRGAWPVRKLASAAMSMIWQADQRVARWLDSRWASEGEAAGYFVVARKPVDTQL